MNALVLFVDDHVETREGYDVYLTSMGARVMTADDGEKAIRLARDLAPDVIVMDLGMPGMSGVEAMRRLKADGRTQRIPIIALSGRYPDPGEAVCDRFLLKPCLPDRLLAVLRELLLQHSSSAVPPLDAFIP
jgi:CheY-like chemotaxis protein